MIHHLQQFGDQAALGAYVPLGVPAGVQRALPSEFLLLQQQPRAGDAPSPQAYGAPAPAEVARNHPHQEPQAAEGLRYEQGGSHDSETGQPVEAGQRQQPCEYHSQGLALQLVVAVEQQLIQRYAGKNRHRLRGLLLEAEREFLGGEGPPHEKQRGDEPSALRGLGPGLGHHGHHDQHDHRAYLGRLLSLTADCQQREREVREGRWPLPIAFLPADGSSCWSLRRVCISLGSVLVRERNAKTEKGTCS